LSYLANIYLNASEMMDLTIVLLYAALLVIITSIVSLRTNDPDPMLAGRNMPWWLVGASITGTSISSMAFLSFTDFGYGLNLSHIVVYLIGVTVNFWLGYFLFATFLRKAPNASIYTLLGQRFGRWASVYAAIIFIFFTTIRSGAITLIVAQGIHAICGVDVVSVMILNGALVIFYTYMSGIEGVIWTDFFQTILLALAGICILYFLTHQTPYSFSEGLAVIQSEAAPEGWIKSIFGGATQPWLVLLLFTIFNGITFYGSCQGTAQRYLVARSDGHAKGGVVFGGLSIVFCTAMFYGLGIALFLYYHHTGHLITDCVMPEAKGAFANFLGTDCPNGLKGLAIVGVLAAAMSTIDTGINSSSTVLICNLYEPFVKSSSPNQALRTMQILRASSAIFGLAGLAMGYFAHLNSLGALRFMWVGMGFVNFGVLALFLILRFNKSIGTKGAITGLFMGTIVSFWAMFTSGKGWAWACPWDQLAIVPLCTTTTIIVAWLTSFLLKEQPFSLLLKGPSVSPKARHLMATRRRRTKKNIFADALRPKSAYRLYAAAMILIELLIYNEGDHLGLLGYDYWFLWGSVMILSLVIAMPWVIEMVYHKAYITLAFLLLAIALPFCSAMVVFAHPENASFAYFFLFSIGMMGTMVGWSILSMATILAIAAAAQATVFLNGAVGIPDNWPMLCILVLAIFTYYAMSAAKEVLITERTMERVHTIIEKIHHKAMNTSLDLLKSKRTLNLQDADRLVKISAELQMMLGALMGATNINPEETHLELSIRETLQHISRKFSQKFQNSIEVLGKDFLILGDRDIFESIITHLFENIAYYIDRKEATRVVCTLDPIKRTLTLSNNGPQISASAVPYIFDLGYTHDKEGLGVGLSYCKKMLQGMRSGIRLVSRPSDKWVQFRLYFPRYHQLPESARMYPINDPEGIETAA
jgi:SSS family solute:Na+ symporter